MTCLLALLYHEQADDGWDSFWHVATGFLKFI